MATYQFDKAATTHPFTMPSKSRVGRTGQSSTRSFDRDDYIAAALDGAGFGMVAGLVLSYYWTLTSGAPTVIVAGLFAIGFAVLGALWSSAACVIASSQMSFRKSLTSDDADSLFATK